MLYNSIDRHGVCLSSASQAFIPDTPEQKMVTTPANKLAVI